MQFSVAPTLYNNRQSKCNTYLTAKGSFILCGLFLFQGGTVGIQIKGAFAPSTLYNCFQLLFFFGFGGVALTAEHITDFIKC